MHTKPGAADRDSDERRPIYVGAAGWAIPRAVAGEFGAEGGALCRYAGRFPATEVNSTFRKSHRPATFERWAGQVADDFRFSVKAPRRITHEKALAAVGDDLRDFVQQLEPFGSKLGPLLFQLPPKLAFDAALARLFLDDLRAIFDGQVALEPRHPSWFAGDVADRLADYRIARVAADPPPAPAAADPAGWTGLTYLRLHGSPRIYYSAYGQAYLESLAKRLRGLPGAVWCIFDNTASGEATADALGLMARLRVSQGKVARA